MSRSLFGPDYATKGEASYELRILIVGVIWRCLNNNRVGLFAYAARRLILAICTMVGGMRTRLT